MPREKEQLSIRKGDSSQIKHVTWAGFVINVFLTAVKFITGIIGGSQAVIADAVHSLSDIVTDMAVILGLKFWLAPPDEEHPFGHRRIETLVTMGIGVSLAMVAFGVGYRAVATMRDEDLVQPGWFTAVGPLLSIILKEILYQWTAAVGRKTKSPAVSANAWHHRSDAMSSVPAFIAVAVSQFSLDLAFVDHVGAVIVSMFILKVAWDISRPVLAELSGQSAGREDCRRIKEIVMGIKDVVDLHKVRTRRHGTGILMDLHILVSGDLSVRSGHDVAEEVKKQLLEKGPEIVDVVVHIEPAD